MGHLQIIRWKTYEDPIRKVAEDVAEVLSKTGSFYRYGSNLVRIGLDRNLNVITKENCNAHISEFLEIIQHGERSSKPALLSHEQKGIFCYSPQILNKFQQIKVFTRSPVFDESWNFINSKGYYPTSQIYYAGDKIEVRKTSDCINALLKDFPWKTPADRSNYLGLLITLLTMPHWVSSHGAGVFNGSV